ncbi:MAG: hypothetical protein PHF99_12855 [Bacteroidales bacterium]|nr:hypothetical protein [Bacteroidales bacterium]
MKNRIKPILVLILILTVQSSCTIEKRHYMKGYHVYRKTNIPIITRKADNKSANETFTNYNDANPCPTQKAPLDKIEDIYASTESDMILPITKNKTNIAQESNYDFTGTNKTQDPSNKTTITSKNKKTNKKTIKNISKSKDNSIIWQIIFLALTVFGIIKMAFEIGKRPYKELTIEEIKAKRKFKDLPEESTDEESEAAWNLMATSTESWFKFTDENGEEFIKPYKKKHLKATSAVLKSVQEMLPTDPEVLERLNEVGYFANSMAKRRFAGSLPLILVACGALLFLTLIIGGPFFPALFSSWWLIASIVFYIFSSRAPQYLIDKRLANYSGRNITSSFLAGFLSIFTSTPATETVEYTYSSGRKETVEELNWGKVILFILIATVFLILGMAIHIFGLLNLLRNYVFYF